MGTPTSPSPLGRVTLVTGPEELLNQRAVESARALVSSTVPEAEHSETFADQLTTAALSELTAPSLFSSVRCAVVRGLEGLPEESHEGLLAYADRPFEEVALVLVHGGGAKGGGLLTRLRRLPSVTEHRSEAMKPADLPRFVTAEARTLGGRIDREAAHGLVRAVGPDLRGLAGAVHQLVSDFPGETLSVQLVERYFAGRAEVKSFVVADAAMSGHTSQALTQLRWALVSGTPAVLVVGAFAASLRGLARVVSAPPGAREGDLAREAGVPPWKLRTLKDQARGWDEAGVAIAIRAVARADADVKGQAADAPYALERMLLTVTAARRG